MATTRSLPSSRKKKPNLAFYEAPINQTTSAHIIEEARRSVRTLPTDRPFTPTDSGRILFGSQGSLSRPPSVYSIGARHFSDERLSRPPTGHKLAPIEKTLTAETSIKVPSRLKPTPPTPVQSFQDLLDPALHSRSDSRLPKPPEDHSLVPRPSARLAAASHSMIMTGGLESASGSSLCSNESGELEPKPSQSSPVLSKRSLSAGTRVLSGGRKSNRVVSAGNEREKMEKVSNSQQTELRQRTLKESEPGRKSGPRSEKKVQKGSSPKHHEPTNRKSDALIFWDTEVAPLLSELDTTGRTSLPDSSGDISRLCKVCNTLWTVLERRGLLGRTGGAGGSKRRSAVLKAVFRLLDHKDPQLLLKLSKIILAMRVAGKNLLNVCKLLFAVAKQEENDHLFLEEHISGPLVELLLTADPLVDPEAMVYGLGTIKLLAGNSSLREELAGARVMSLLANTLQKCTDPSTDHTKTHIGNMLVQLTAALRNLSESPSLKSEFLSSCVIPRLCGVLADQMRNADIVFNISRLLSKLTLQTECREAVVRCPAYLPLLLQSLTAYAGNTDIVVRVCFILGNLTAEDARMREQLFFSHSALPVINSLATKYFSLETKGKAAKSSKKPVSKSEDVLIKLVRLVANLSVSPEVGPAIASSEATVDQLLRILDSLSISLYEELVLNTLATLNNLSFYAQPESCVVQRQQEIAELLVRIILEDNNNEGLLECTRVYGNLSRYPAVRQILDEKKVSSVMVTLLDSGRRELVYASCGVLINLMADSTHRTALQESSGVRKMVEVLHDFGQSDWQLAGLVCKTLWNYSERLTSSAACFGEEETELLIQLLETYSTESFILELPAATPEENRAAHASWKNDFLPVAQNLLTRIQAHHTHLVPLESHAHSPPSDS